MAIRTGKSYERQVMRHLTQERPHIAFELNAKVLDTTGQYERQIDVWLPDTREIVECKHYTRPVDIGVVDRLVGTVQDVDAAVGHIFSSNGFTDQAAKRARKAGITCTPLSFATKFETYLRPSGNGYYFGEYFELCLCSTTPLPAGNTWTRISYFSKDDNDFDTLSTGLSIDWGDVNACRFITYLLLAHMLRRPPSDSAIDEFMDSYGNQFELGQEWVISEDKIRRFTWPELA
jgi:Restriction endonuclease